eukprot:1309057-Rhodomonas_salina.2
MPSLPSDSANDVEHCNAESPSGNVDGVQGNIRVHVGEAGSCGGQPLGAAWFYKFCDKCQAGA